MPFLDRYINAWAVRIAERGVTGCGFSSSSSEGGVLHMMDPDANSEDKAIRNDLQRVKLNEMLARQERERVEDAMHPRNCLFCKHVLENRHELFKHMFNEHSFNIGLPDNLVEINEFLDLVSAKLTSLQCIYCEKLFKSSAVLRKHMRKKKHFKINPRNQGYDRFYIINYLEPGKNWESYQNEQYESDEDKDGNEWEDWKDASDADRTMCLFDENVFDTVADAVAHLNFAHGFDLKQIRAAAGLDFYGVIRLINFIRQKAAHGACHHCGQAFETMEGLAAHYVSTDHARMIPQPSDSLWSDPMYLFPTYDDDPLLTWDNEEEED
ncbi:hypothetical protein DFJ73DRAFT_860861 [Zopfochytrium polystomum]|nr:hypothetical protein DFJ73DRAFT_860861 [Zopfochytrium polystomum]